MLKVSSKRLIALLFGIAMSLSAQVQLNDIGSVNAYEVTYPANLNGIIPAGMEFTFRANNANTGASTLLLTGTTTRSIVKNFNTPLDANDIKAGHFVRVIYDATNLTWQMLSSSANPSSGVSGSGAINGVGYFTNASTITADGTSFTFNKGNYTNLSIGKINIRSTSTSGDNLSLGSNAGNTTMSGSNNIVVGNSTGQALTSGNDNAFFGVGSGNKNTSGSSNTFFGSGAAFNNTSGNFNSIFGSDAGINSISDHNTFFGRAAGQTNTSGNNNVAIGSGADMGTGTLTNAIAIGANAIVNTSNSLVLGGTGANAVNVGIGTGTPAARLQVIGTGVAYNSNNAQVRISTSEDPNRTLLIGYDPNLVSSAGTGFIQTLELPSLYTNLILNPLGGNVAIAGTNPQQKLDVFGGARIRNLSSAGTNLVAVNASGDLQLASAGSFLTGSGTTGQVPYFASASALLGTNIFRYDGSNVAINTNPSTSYLFQVLQNSNSFPAVYGENDQPSGVGLWGSSTNTGGQAGVRGTSVGSGYGVYGTNSSNGYGVFGANSGTGYGVYGQSGASGIAGFFDAGGTGVAGYFSGRVGIGIASPGFNLVSRTTAIAATAETLAQFDVSDGGGSYVQIKNATNADGIFEPMIEGNLVGSNNSFVIRGVSNNDALGAPLVMIDSKFTSGSLGAKPLFGVSNNGTQYLSIGPTGVTRLSNLSGSGGAVFANASGDLFVSSSSGANAWTMSGANIYPTNPLSNLAIGLNTSTAPGIVSGATRYFTLSGSQTYSAGAFPSMEIFGSINTANLPAGRVDFVNNTTPLNTISNYARIEGRSGNSVVGHGQIAFYTNNGTLTEKMRLSEAGRLGIGLNPANNSAQLQVSDLANTTGQIRVFAGTATGETGTDGLLISLAASGVSFQNYETTPMQFGTGGSAVQMTLSAAGNLGLKTGVSNPTSKLAVDGNATIGTSYYNILAPTNGLLVQGNIGIGTTAPGSNLHVENNGGFAEGDFYTYGNNYSAFVMGKARGTQGTPTATQFGDVIGALIFRGHNGTAWQTVASQMRVDATENFVGGTNMGSRIVFSTVQNGTPTSNVRMTIDHAGAVSIGDFIAGSRLGVDGGVAVGTNYRALVAPTNGMLVEGRVGLGTTAPGYKLHVSENNTAPNYAPVWVDFTSTATSGGNPAINASVLGIGNAPGTDYYGVYGISRINSNTNGQYATGVYGEGSKSLGNHTLTGVWGEARTTNDGENYGVYGRAFGSTLANYGVSGTVSNTGGTDNYAGYFLANSSGTNSYGVFVTVAGGALNKIGVYSNVTPGANAYSGIFLGGFVGIGAPIPLAPMHLSTPGFNGYVARIENPQNTAGRHGLLLSVGNNLNTTTIAGFFSAGVERMTIRADGNVGIASPSPTAKLDVGGNFKLGTNGTVLQQIIYASTTTGAAFGNCAANSSINIDLAVANTATSDKVWASSAALVDGLVIQSALVSAAGTVRIRVRNVTAAAVTLNSTDFNVIIIKP